MYHPLSICCWQGQWLHPLGVVLSTVYQKIKVIRNDAILTTFRDSLIQTSINPDTHVLEVQRGEEEIDLSGFQYEETVAVQNLLAEIYYYLNPQEVSMMKMMGYLPGMGLGKDLQGISEPINFVDNCHCFGIGYEPTEEDFEKKEEQAHEKARVLKEGREVSSTSILVKRPPETTRLDATTNPVPRNFDASQDCVFHQEEEELFYMEEVYSPWDEVEWIMYDGENTKGEWLADEENHAFDGFSIKAMFKAFTLEDSRGKKRRAAGAFVYLMMTYANQGV
ncbi:hypothetical protein Acr_02g0009830 [Actinidia rufa]|uniref:G-patch domain-containing protein n=1 Tax=Actinidia rufa TaxID=165716 RepID=A0A7J0E8D9_9ERIC|nr:hypothetical protein Acr_02g0009830 [Actinidia rufa]